MNFSHPSQPPTPPDTDADILVGAHHPIDVMTASGLHIVDQDTNPPLSVGAPSRRVSTLAYHSSPLRDPRERPNGRQSRWLIVIIPPVSLAEDHGPLGHTLASGPTQRLSQGILMPLQPTMYGQLTAIAREFNFPSPVGLCLYLRATEQGISMTPRISDDIWPALWGHLFESRSPVPTFQMPICGRVEFDIDTRKALWLDSWLTSDRRHAVDVPVSVPPSLSHHRGDSKNSFFDERGDEHAKDLSTLHPNSQSHHIPKKLSLVDRLEAHTLIPSRANATGSGTAHAQSNSLALVLDDEPKPAKIALEKRVESWRASSSVAPTPMATTSQIPDPENIPNNLQLTDLDILADTNDEINLNDFAWSASSLGPPDHDSLPSAVSESHVLSVHLDRRLKGSVLLPSPDIAQRVIEDCPPTPPTATSRGPEELLYSPASVKFRLPSPDLGQRMLEDCPPTPVTGTSWRYPRSAISTISHFPSLNPDMNMLSIWPYTPSNTTYCLPGMSGTSGTAEPDSSSLIYPYLSDPSHPMWTFVWPLYKVENPSNSLPLQFPDRLPTWTFGWPLYEAENVSNSLPSQFPDRNFVDEAYQAQLDGLTGCKCTSVLVVPLEAGISLHLPQVYPRDTLYPAVYPELGLYPPVSAEEIRGIPKTAFISQGPSVYPWLQVYPGRVSAGQNHVATSRMLQAVYPQFDIYPAVYPRFDIYTGSPKVGGQRVSPLSSLSVMLATQYPTLNLYAPTYPHFEIYPPVMQAQGISVSKQPTLVNARIPSQKYRSIGESGALSPIPNFRRVKRAHKALHEEVFALVKASVELALSKPPVENQARYPTSSRTPNAHLAIPQSASSVPPVPPLPVSMRSSLRMPSHNAEVRHGGSSTPPSEPSQPTDRPTTKNTQPLSTRSEESIARSNSLTSHNSSSRKDHGHSKQGLRPRDSLILEKARHFDHPHTLPHNGRPSSVVGPAHFSVPPVPQLINIPHLQKLEHTRYPSA